ncbi:MAG TPA: DNA polymerase Y family protein, partial [Gemmobacter sp.]|nr:DNA polymerase Y family protein [Gemmobacter sp.]
LDLRRVDRQASQIEIGLARPMRDPARIKALFAKGVEEIDAGFGIDALRLSAPVTEPLAPEQIGSAPAHHEDALADLLSSLGNRIGFDRVLRLLPSDSLIPERSFTLAPAAYSQPAPSPTHRSRPAILFPPEAVTATGHPPVQFRWCRMQLTTLRATGPERISAYPLQR